MLDKRQLSKLAATIAVLAVTAIAAYTLLTNNSAELDSDTAARPYKADPATLRDTDSGQVIGFSDSNNTFSWLGIPYAASPVGDLRWRAPQPPEQWPQQLAPPTA